MGRRLLPGHRLVIIDSPDQPRIVGHYIQPPFSVLNRRERAWQQRRAEWRAVIPDDAIGRTATSTPTSGVMAIGDGISRFDPVVAELFYRWWTVPGDIVYDPFCGGPTRGAVAHMMGRPYIGVDVRPEQITANRATFDGPTWRVGDARDSLDEPVDAILTCPPYVGLERYSDLPSDLSTLTWDSFAPAMRDAIRAATSALREDRFAGFVVGDVRDSDGGYVGLPDLVRDSLVGAGLSVVATVVLVDPIGTRRLVGWKNLAAGRIVQRVHQELIVAVKGDRKAAATRITEWTGK